MKGGVHSGGDPFTTCGRGFDNDGRRSYHNLIIVVVCCCCCWLKRRGHTKIAHHGQPLVILPQYRPSDQQGSYSESDTASPPPAPAAPLEVLVRPIGRSLGFVIAVVMGSQCWLRCTRPRAAEYIALGRVQRESDARHHHQQRGATLPFPTIWILLLSWSVSLILFVPTTIIARAARGALWQCVIIWRVRDAAIGGEPSDVVRAPVFLNRRTPRRHHKLNRPWGAQEVMSGPNHLGALIVVLG